MKTVISLLFVVILCVLCLVSASAAPVSVRSESALVTDAGAENEAVVSDDVEEDGINLTAATTLIVVICAVLTVCTAVMVAVLARRNRDDKRANK